MKDMERWAKIQNRQKESVRAPSPLLKVGVEDERRQSKSADAAFAIFERKVRDGMHGFILLNISILCCFAYDQLMIYSTQLEMIFLRNPLLHLRKMRSLR